MPVKTQHRRPWRDLLLCVVAGSLFTPAASRSLGAQQMPNPYGFPIALELARKFSGEEAVQFVNGVLDAVHRELVK